MKQWILSLCVAVAVLGSLSSAMAEMKVYRWEDSRGVVHFTQDITAVPTKGGYEVFRMPDDQSDPKPTEVVIPVTFQSGVPTVEVMINDTWSADFMVDTGASVTIMSRSLVESLGIFVDESRGHRILNTAQGKIEAVAVVVESLSLGTAEVYDIEVLVPLEGIAPNLLGQNFLENFVMTLDRGNGTLQLKDTRTGNGL